MAAQIANTIRERVSDMTVAPTVTVTGSRRVSPSCVMIGKAQERMRCQQ